MSTPIGADLQALLAEIPDSGTLLRVTPEQLVRGFRGTVDRARARQTGLLPVEAHLLAVHREELAHALLEECAMRLYEDKEARWRFSWDRTPNRNSQRTREALKHGSHLTTKVKSIQANAPLPFEAMPTSELAHLALRLAPSARGQVLQGLELSLIRHEEASATKLLQRVLFLGASEKIDRSASNLLGDILERQGKPDLAVEAVRRAKNPTTIASGFNLFLFGLEAGDWLGVAQGAETLESCSRDHPRATEAFIGERVRLFSSGKWRFLGSVESSAARNAIKPNHRVAERLIDALNR